jgi:hypothetical protein
MIGVVLGAILGSDGAAAKRYARIRLVHYRLNLVGLVGFTIIGTLPTFLTTLWERPSGETALPAAGLLSKSFEGYDSEGGSDLTHIGRSCN